jgi:transcription initiation factor IIE alpha subunit
MNHENYVSDRLWNILVETVHELVMFTWHKAYTRDSIIPEKPDVTSEELAARLRIPFGEALVILFELKTEKHVQP